MTSGYVAGLAATTLNQLVQPVIELCTFYDVLPWDGQIPTDLPHDIGLVVLIMGYAIVAGVAVHLFRRGRK
ncbi:MULTISPECIES: hypothetical protein [unclassified Streptomyces]|uniref:hypothetical protein n=1 Tax=unclassified Streptomyces TaxID=2593676 RepID=UPI002E195A14|nr:MULTISPECIES: hypothetical protein [unclassified Streptomyces]